MRDDRGRYADGSAAAGEAAACELSMSQQADRRSCGDPGFDEAYDRAQQFAGPAATAEEAADRQLEALRCGFAAAATPEQGGGPGFDVEVYATDHECRQAHGIGSMRALVPDLPQRLAAWGARRADDGEDPFDHSGTERKRAFEVAQIAARSGLTAVVSETEDYSELASGPAQSMLKVETFQSPDQVTFRDGYEDQEPADEDEAFRGYPGRHLVFHEDDPEGVFIHHRWVVTPTDVADDPPLPHDEWEAEFGDWESTPGGACGAIRSDTLGYQRCWLPRAHPGHRHKSQDGERW